MATSDFQLSEFLPYRLAVLSERVSRRLSVEYGRLHGLSVAEWRVLVHLSGCAAVSVRDIQTCVNLEKSRVSRAVSRLETDGLVRKVQGANDGRLVAISLTVRGREVLEDILPIALEIERGLLAALSPEELDTLESAMEKLHAVLDDDPRARPRMAPDLLPIDT